MEEESTRIRSLRDRLWSGLQTRISDIHLNGHPELRLSGNANVSFSGVNSEALMMQLKDVVALSSGSACTTADPEPSHVLTAMGVSEDLIESTIRFGLGRFNNADEIEIVLEQLAGSVRKLRGLS